MVDQNVITNIAFLLCTLTFDISFFIYRGICSNRTNDPVKDRLEPYFKPLAAAYKEICETQEKDKRAFFGLIDFYRLESSEHNTDHWICTFVRSLIKMLYWMCEVCNCSPSGRQLEHVIKRNFGGGYFDTYSIFIYHIGNLSNVHEVKVNDRKVSGISY